MSTTTSGYAGHPQMDYTPVDAEHRAVAKKLTLFYVIASTAIFLVAGLLGMVLRQSQADIVRLDDNYWYAVMTAHGLGAFVGWAAFAVMGFSYWVLAEVGYPIGTLARRIGMVAWWTMVLGVAGVVVTTLIFSFGGSWVFLYPLPFESAGQWGDNVTAFFSFSVLLAGVSIIAWCVSIIVIVTGPGLGSDKSGPNRLGAAMGLGILWPRKFVSAKPVPYPVIPLTVIAIDMIIATVPLAVLLVEMIFESYFSISVDPLLAKNVLWWFGHPVVYLLLFPAVAIYYLLIPRFAKRPLVAGNIIAVGWTIAVIANVTVWAHHLYMDYPDGIQAAINTGMEPLTFALTIVSALSLYSLMFTIYKSRWTWTAGSTALFLGLVAWLLAGLSGVVNATIAWDAFVHNTLWIVGHFHHMALLNIGIVVFGAIYTFLPDLIGKQLYSDRMGMWHVWLTTFAGTMFSAIWIWQGLDGAPRRFAVLPSQYDTLTAASIPVLAVLALAQLLFVFNLVQTFRGKTSAYTQRISLGVSRPKLTSPAIQGGVMVVSLVGILGLALGGWAIGNANQDDATAAFLPPIEQPAGGGGSDNLAAGQQVFVATGCGGCHVLAAAGGAGEVGPNLDETKPSKELTVDRVTNGLNAMPAFASQLSPDQIDAVAEYVSESAGSSVAQVIPIPLTAVALPLQADGHAHGGEAAMDHWAEWHFDPWVLLVCGALTYAYALGWRRLRRRGGPEWATVPRAISFLVGINVIVLALVTPLHHLGMDYLLSAHMVQHMMVGDIAPLLLCLGVYGPMRFFVVPQPVLRWAGGPGMRPVIRFLGRPQVAFWAWCVATGIWYVPSFYVAALDNAAVHYVMWVSIFITGVAIWSHILAMVPHMRMSHAKRAGYAVAVLFAGMLVSEFLFLNQPLYDVYVNQPDRLFDLSPEADQIRASLIMTGEQMITLLMAATLIMWNHVDGAVAERAADDAAALAQPPPEEPLSSAPSGGRGPAPAPIASARPD